jgi:hypothetical protein
MLDEEQIVATALAKEAVLKGERVLVADSPE